MDKWTIEDVLSAEVHSLRSEFKMLEKELADMRPSVKEPTVDTNNAEIRQIVMPSGNVFYVPQEQTEKRNRVMKEPWNLGNGMSYVYDSIRRKLNYASHQLEDRPRTIINMDSYENTVLIWALSEWAERKGLKK